MDARRVEFQKLIFDQTPELQEIVKFSVHLEKILDKEKGFVDKTDGTYFTTTKAIKNGMDYLVSLSPEEAVNLFLHFIDQISTNSQIIKNASEKDIKNFTNVLNTWKTKLQKDVLQTKFSLENLRRIILEIEKKEIKYSELWLNLCKYTKKLVVDKRPEISQLAFELQQFLNGFLLNVDYSYIRFEIKKIESEKTKQQDLVNYPVVFSNTSAKSALKISQTRAKVLHRIANMNPDESIPMILDRMRKMKSKIAKNGTKEALDFIDEAMCMLTVADQKQRINGADFLCWNPIEKIKSLLAGYTKERIIGDFTKLKLNFKLLSNSKDLLEDLTEISLLCRGLHMRLYTEAPKELDGSASYNYETRGRLSKDRLINSAIGMLQIEIGDLYLDFAEAIEEIVKTLKDEKRDESSAALENPNENTVNASLIPAQPGHANEGGKKLETLKIDTQETDTAEQKKLDITTQEEEIIESKNLELEQTPEGAQIKHFLSRKSSQESVLSSNSNNLKEDDELEDFEKVSSAKTVLLGGGVELEEHGKFVKLIAKIDIEGISEAVLMEKFFQAQSVLQYVFNGGKVPSKDVAYETLSINDSTLDPRILEDRKITRLFAYVKKYALDVEQTIALDFIYSDIKSQFEKYLNSGWTEKSHAALAKQTINDLQCAGTVTERIEILMKSRSTLIGLNSKLLLPSINEVLIKTYDELIHTVRPLPLPSFFVNNNQETIQALPISQASIAFQPVPQMTQQMRDMTLSYMPSSRSVQHQPRSQSDNSLASSVMSYLRPGSNKPST